MTRREYFDHALSVALVGGVWALPCFLFVPFGTQTDQIAFWALTAMLITGTALAFAATPMTTLVFALVTGLGAIAAFSLDGYYGYAALAASFCGLAMGGTIRSARIYLASRIAEAGVAEQSEVVSLLLREFEENEAD